MRPSDLVKELTINVGCLRMLGNPFMNFNGVELLAL